MTWKCGRDEGPLLAAQQLGLFQGGKRKEKGCRTVHARMRGIVWRKAVRGGVMMRVQLCSLYYCNRIAMGSMCYTSGFIQMENVYVPEQEVGVWQWLFGKTVTSVVYLNSGSSDGFVGIAAPTLARILPIDLAMFGGEILCQPDAFLCSVNDVKVSSSIDQRPRNAVVGAPGLLRQKLSGQGLAFIIGGGSVVQKNLEVGEVLAVDASCIVALTAAVNVQVKYNTPMRRAVFGGDNQVTAVLTGPGIVFIQSLPFQKLSQRVARAVTAPNMRENPKFFIQLAMFFLLAYIVILSSLILTDV